ncbi:class II aldolase/adducin N-terminal [Daedaleopsis nitida]|nr:class II aldolase/adducin N-terminal [Daedaleopsis nitida]
MSSIPESATTESHSLPAGDPVVVGTRPKPPKFTSKEQEREILKIRLAQALRIFFGSLCASGKLGHVEDDAGHFTVRDPIRPNYYWPNPFGKHFCSVQPSDLVLIDEHGNLQPDESGPTRFLGKPALIVHCAHMLPDRTSTALRTHIQSTADHAVYKHFEGIVHAEEKGAHMVEAPGSKKAVIVQNHDTMVAAKYIEATLHFFIALEKYCHVQLLADAAATGTGGNTIKIGPE